MERRVSPAADSLVGAVPASESHCLGLTTAGAITAMDLQMPLNLKALWPVRLYLVKKETGVRAKLLTRVTMSCYNDI